MSPRWLFCWAMALTAPAVYAQTAPVASPGFEAAPDDGYYDDGQDAVDEDPIAPSPPPALPPESPSVRPFADAVWTSGHWYWDDNQWRFKQGAWVARMPGYQYVNGYWQQDGDVWRWISGGWAPPGSTQVEIPIEVASEEVMSAQAPPQLQAETPPPAPAANYTWAPGYWYWSGSDWAWIQGDWVAPPRPGLRFVSPRWVRRGPSWYFVAGGWAARGSVRVVVPEYRHAQVSVRWGHPNYFFHSWHRYPVVRYRHYSHDRGHPGSGHYDRYRGGGRPSHHHEASPGRPSYGGRRGDGHRGDGHRGDGHHGGGHHR
ncbi:YXWGXW repeat-containing protein [Stigmatella aurantiaca]|uniref:Conserved uncharacterized protein n=1 Tax=Stigmatella aurantiaca (strain DW4/3-1) TaxID=378806 RepID=Q08ZG1_STIAD|nr:YXWGXW repeat-containing protein [Stigmatella aurantiaca]ADO71561.1 conserved uncharacterized protein [Stigmatella aurantiaca DW4/3-1]EAU65900.1 conserved hypothetical protein [Stigmatella aurantiaca DW4/3-1]